MLYIRNIVFVYVIYLLAVACVDEYDPGINTYQNLLVIDGGIIKEDSIQRIFVSRSTSISNPEYNPVSGCNIFVTDRDGNKFTFSEKVSGEYQSAIPSKFLQYNSEFQLTVETNDQVYQSKFETILESSPIDSLYYLVEAFQSSSESHESGLQFYTDLKAPPGATKNYLWSVEETWEIHTKYAIEGFWEMSDVEEPKYRPVSDSIDICWSTEMINRNYTSSTDNLVVNEKKMIPLSYLPSTSKKINEKYSILVKQYSLSTEAFKYHEQNNLATEGTGGLYTRQPNQSRSNINNVNNPDEVILGFFWASSYSQKRIFFNGPLSTYNDKHCDYVVPCTPGMNERLIDFFRRQGRESLFLVALTFSQKNPDSVSLWGYPYDQECIDCTANGATVEKPDFWR